LSLSAQSKLLNRLSKNLSKLSTKSFRTLTPEPYTISTIPSFVYVAIKVTMEPIQNKRLANAKRPSDCSVLCLHLKSSLCSCLHYILDPTGHFQRIFRVEGENSQQPPLEWKN